MFKNILVPVDLEHADVGRNSLKKAAELADEGAKIVLLHVVAEIPAYASGYLPEGILDKRSAEAKEHLEEMARGAGVSAECVVMTSGRPSTAILEAAEEKKSDCIIVASHHPGLQDYFLGSTAARVVRHADCSVLILR